MLKDFEISGVPVEGYFSADDQVWIIRPQSEWKFYADRCWLCLGGPGVDGIEFGLLKGQKFMFAYYPIDDEYIKKAETVEDFLKLWFDGSVSI